MSCVTDEGRGSGNTTWFGGPPVYGWTIPMRDRATFWTSVRGNVRKGVGSVHSLKAELKVRTNPRCKPAAGMRAATRGLVEDEGRREEMLNGCAPGINEAELAMRDEPDVELRCQTIRSSRSLKRC
jgi:hypothetical protein